jgi:hypothetical protein
MVMPGVVLTADQHWSQLPDATRAAVLVLLARMIARGVVEEGSDDDDG